MPSLANLKSLRRLEGFFLELDDVQDRGYRPGVVVDEDVDLRRTSTPELACNAGTSGTLSADDLSRRRELAVLLFSWLSAESQRDLQILRPLTLYLSCSATFEFSARK